MHPIHEITKPTPSSQAYAIEASVAPFTNKASPAVLPNTFVTHSSKAVHLPWIAKGASIAVLIIFV